MYHAALSFNHSIGCTHSWRFSICYKKIEGNAPPKFNNSTLISKGNRHQASEPNTNQQRPKKPCPYYSSKRNAQRRGRHNHSHMVFWMALWVVVFVWRVGRVMRGAWGKEGAGVRIRFNYCWHRMPGEMLCNMTKWTGYVACMWGRAWSERKIKILRVPSVLQATYIIFRCQMEESTAVLSKLLRIDKINTQYYCQIPNGSKSSTSYQVHNS